MGKEEQCRQKLQDIQEKMQEAISVMIVFETDLSAECSDGVYYRVIKVIHRMMTEVQHTVEELVQSIEKSSE